MRSQKQLANFEMAHIRSASGHFEPINGRGSVNRGVRRSSKFSVSSNLFDSSDSNAVSSQYWRVPDSSQYLSAIAIHETDPLIAVTSGADQSNLFIYGLGQDPLSSSSDSDHILTHHQTISLGGIHSIDWVSPTQRLGSEGNVVATGHNDGYAHLILLPDPYSTHVPAEIVKRFNHNRHVKMVATPRIKNLQLAPNCWSCCPPSAITSSFSEHLFLWDPSRSDMPIFKKRVRGISCFDMCSIRDGIIAVGAYRGISIKDVRIRNSGLCPPVGNDSPVSCVKWAPTNDNLMITVHDTTVIKVWDIRNSSPVLTVKGHSDRINTLQWSESNDNEFYSASSDGTIRMWNVKTCLEADLSGSLDSTATAAGDSDWLPTKPWKLYQQRLSRYDASFNICEYFVENARKPPSTTIFSNDRQFLDLAVMHDQILSVDSQGYFGLHETKDRVLDSDNTSSGDEFSIPGTP